MASYSSDPILVVNSGKSLVTVSITLSYKNFIIPNVTGDTSVGTFRLYGIGLNDTSILLYDALPYSSSKYSAFTIYSPVSRDRYPAIRWELDAGPYFSELYDVSITQEVIDSYIDDPHSVGGIVK